MKFNSLSLSLSFFAFTQSKNFIFNIEFELFSNRIWFQTILVLFFVLFFLFVDNQVPRHLSMFFSFYFLSDISHTCWLPLQKHDRCFFFQSMRLINNLILVSNKSDFKKSGHDLIGLSL